MPRIATLNSVAIFIYGNDHAPPHFHVRSGDSDCTIDIGALEVTAGHVSRRDLARVLAWASENRASLMAKWDELNARE